MPEAYVSTNVDFTLKHRPSLPSVKISTGIGDSDGFPIFDSDDGDNYSTPNDTKWGFRITGGAEFKMPITVFQVTEDGLAEKGGIKLGDNILEINNIDATHLTLAEAHDIIENSKYSLYLVAESIDDYDMSGAQVERKNVVLRSSKPLEKPVEQPRERASQSIERKVWHPVVWQQPPPPVEEHYPEEGKPHARIIRNIRKFFKETEGKPEVRQKYVEDMLLALPGSSKSS